MERIPTGIEKFDELVFGGFPKNSIVLISGVPGSGKTIFCMQAAVNLAKKGRKVLYILVDNEDLEDLIIQANKLGIELESMVKEGKVRVVRAGSMKEFKDVLSKSSEEGFSVVVLDSISGVMAKVYKPEEVSRYVIFQETTIFGVLDPMFAVRNMVSEIFEYLKSLKFDLVFVITDRVPGESSYSRDKVSEFVADGIVEFNTLGIGGAFNRTMRIIKLRKSDHSKDPITFEIVDGKGIVITEEEIEKIAEEF